MTDDIQTNEWVSTIWAGCSGWLALVLLAGAKKRRAAFSLVDGAAHAATSEALETAAAEGNDLYVGCTTLMRPLGIGEGRGRKRDVFEMPGLWAEIDTAPSEAVPLLEALPVPPTAYLLSGGGVHAWWLFEEGPIDIRSDAGKVWASRAERAWLVYLQDATGMKLDPAHDLARVLRLPPSLNWKRVRKGEEIRPRPVSIGNTDGDRVSWKTLAALYEPAWAPHERRLREAREVRDRTFAEAVRTAPGDWGARLRSGLLEEQFNAYVTWEQILGPLGWQISSIGPDGGERYWTRPGKSVDEGHSASEGFNGSHLLVLYSSAPETGLTHVRDMNRVSKLEAFVELYHDGDWVSARRAIANEKDLDETLPAPRAAAPVQ